MPPPAFAGIPERILSEVREKTEWAVLPADRRDDAQFFISGPQASAIVYDIKHAGPVIRALCEATGDDREAYATTDLRDSVVELDPDLYTHAKHIEIIATPGLYAGIDPFHVRGGGLTLLAPSMVYHPHPLSGSTVMIENMPGDLRGLDCLDLGCGAGVIALSMLARGARQVTATDISARACAATECNAILNAARLDHRLPIVHCGDLFDPLTGLSVEHRVFDLIAFNLPLMDKEPGASVMERDAEESLCDPGGRLLARFLTEVAGYLKPGGRALFPHSSISSPLPEDILMARGLTVRVVAEQSLPWRAEAFALMEVARADSVSA